METPYKTILYTYEAGSLIKEDHMKTEEQPSVLQVYEGVEAWGSFSHDEVNAMLAEGYRIVKEKVYAKNVLMARFKEETIEKPETPPGAPADILAEYKEEVDLPEPEEVDP